MNERTVVETNAESAVTVAPHSGWNAFEARLAATLSVLKDEILVLSAKAGNRFVQFNARPGLGVFAEAVSSAYLGEAEKLDEGQLAALLALGWSAPTHAPDSPSPVPVPDGSPNHFRVFPHPYSCAGIARVAVRTLAEILRVESPSDLQYNSFDDDGNAVTLPELHIDRAPAPAQKRKPKPVRKGPTPFSRLRAKVLAAARGVTGLGSLDYSDDGSLQIPVGSRTGWVRPYEKPFFVRVHIQILADFEADEELLAKMHEANSRLPMARVICTGGSVFLGVDFPAVPFRAEHLSQAITALASVADDVLKGLRPSNDDSKVAVTN